MKAKRLYIDTVGCQMNVNDSERIVSLLEPLGYQVVTERSSATMIMFNTCSVRAGAEDRLYQNIANLSNLKRKRPGTLIGVAGCVAQQQGEELLARFPWLDFVIGTHTLHLLPALVEQAESGTRGCATQFLDDHQRLDLLPPIVHRTRVSEFVTVMQGCDNYCSYCIVPYVRGREVSRRFDDIMEEVQGLVKTGVKEVVLLGQNVNSYGRTGESQPSFVELVEAVCDVHGIERVRFVTSHPKDMSDGLIECFARLPKLCGAVHLPAQSGSDRILESMNRGYTRDQYLEVIRKLRAVRPDIQITGDMIVGFPGEDDQDFEQTLSLMEEVRYFDLFSFMYSSRPGTAAARWEDRLSRSVKQDRLDRLQRLQLEHSRAHNDSYLGTTQTVLVEGAAKYPDQVSGRADNGRIVNLPGPLSLVGSLVDVRITASYANSLLGEYQP
ncbi:MAG: tRNA (N6-isopentenyl adenosine(37)-C2)-methylthiotransferase MiaB [Trichlorobacter sp.]